ncbi:MAG: hypothetical protein R3F61_07160 [Myxococcota bacterium]
MWLLLASACSPSPRLPVHGARLPEVARAPRVPLDTFAIGCADPDGSVPLAVVELTVDHVYVDGRPVEALDNWRSPRSSGLSDALRALAVPSCPSGEAPRDPNGRLLLLADARLPTPMATWAMRSALSAGFTDLHVAVQAADPTPHVRIPDGNTVDVLLEPESGVCAAPPHDDAEDIVARIWSDEPDEPGRRMRCEPLERVDRVVEGASEALLVANVRRPFADLAVVMEALQGTHVVVEPYFLDTDTPPLEEVVPDPPTSLPRAGSVQVLRVELEQHDRYGR